PSQLLDSLPTRRSSDLPQHHAPRNGIAALGEKRGRRPWRTHGQFPQDATAGRRRPHHSVRCTAQSQSTAAKLTARSRVSSPWTLLIVTVPASSAGSREFSATDAVWPASIGSIVLEPQPVSTVTAELAASASLVTET